MSGLFLAFIALIWLWLLAKLVRLFTSGIKDLGHRVVVALISYCVLLPLPLIDELLGKRQFERLCKENSTVQIDRAAVGKTIYLVRSDSIQLKGNWLPIRLQEWRHVDVVTGETLVAYNTLDVSGGFFIRAIPLYEVRVPITFSEPYCSPKDRPATKEAFAALGINYIERPAGK